MKLRHNRPKTKKDNMQTELPKTETLAAVASSDLLCVTVGDGKYTVKQDASGRLTALRYGEPWRDCVGDGLICALAYEVDSLRERLQRTTHAYLYNQGIPEEDTKREAARVTHNVSDQTREEEAS